MSEAQLSYPNEIGKETPNKTEYLLPQKAGRALARGIVQATEHYLGLVQNILDQPPSDEYVETFMPDMRNGADSLNKIISTLSQADTLRVVLGEDENWHFEASGTRDPQQFEPGEETIEQSDIPYMAIHVDFKTKKETREPSLYPVYGAAAHDFRSNLAPILGYAELIAMRSTSEDVKKHFAQISSPSRSIGEFINTLEGATKITMSTNELGETTITTQHPTPGAPASTP